MTGAGPGAPDAATRRLTARLPAFDWSCSMAVGDRRGFTAGVVITDGESANRDTVGVGASCS